MQKKTPIPLFLKGTDQQYWVKLANSVIDSRWKQHVSYLKELSDKSLPKDFKQGTLEELLQWKEEAQQLMDLGLLSPHQFNKALMLSKLNIPSATAFVGAKGTVVKTY